MKLQRFIFLLLPGLFLWPACGANGNASDRQAEDVPAETAQKIQQEDLQDPCEVLSDELLNAHFDLGNAAVSRSPSKYSPHPLCTASWPKPNAEQIEAENEANMAEYLKLKMAGKDEEARKLRKRSTNQVSLTLDKDTYDTPKAAESSFEGAMKVAREGMTVEVDGEDRETPTYKTEPVEGVGQKAYWLVKLNQLSVVCGTRVFHVGVNISDDRDENLKKAKAIARDLCERFN